MLKYPSFCLRQKSPPAGRVSGWAGKAVHVLGKARIRCWCAFTVALIGWVVLASFTPTRGICQNDLLAAGLDLSGYEVVMERYHIMDYFLNSVLYTDVYKRQGAGRVPSQGRRTGRAGRTGCR